MKNELISQLIALAVASLILVIFMRSSRADSIEIIFASKRIGSEKEYNEINPGLSYKKNLTTGYLTGGAYYNSEKNMSTYAGLGKKFGHGPVKVGIDVGVVTGYKIMPVAPIASPYINYSYFNIRALPLVKKSRLNGVVLGFSMEFNLK